MSTSVIDSLNWSETNAWSCFLYIPIYLRGLLVFSSPLRWRSFLLGSKTPFAACRSIERRRRGEGRAASRGEGTTSFAFNKTLWSRSWEWKQTGLVCSPLSFIFHHPTLQLLLFRFCFHLFPLLHLHLHLSFALVFLVFPTRSHFYLRLQLFVFQRFSVSSDLAMYIDANHHIRWSFWTFRITGVAIYYKSCISKHSCISFPNSIYS